MDQKSHNGEICIFFKKDQKSHIDEIPLFFTFFCQMEKKKTISPDAGWTSLVRPFELFLFVNVSRGFQIFVMYN